MLPIRGTSSNSTFDNDSRITRGMTSFALENHYEKTSGTLSFFYNWGRHKINDGYQIGEEPQKSHFNSKDKCWVYHGIRVPLFYR